MKKNQMEFLFVAGFVLGVALPNLLWKTELEERNKIMAKLINKRTQNQMVEGLKYR